MGYMEYLVDEIVTVEKPTAYLRGNEYFGTGGPRRAKILSGPREDLYGAVTVVDCSPNIVAAFNFAELVAAESPEPHYSSRSKYRSSNKQKRDLSNAVVSVVLESHNKSAGFNKTVYQVRLRHLSGFRPEVYKKMLKELT